MSSLPIDRHARNSGRDRLNPTGATVDLEPIRTAIERIRFVEMRIVIQPGVVIQIDRMEKRWIR
jgi:hypothetical protein